MRNLLCSLAFVAVATSPAVAQTVPQGGAPAEKPKMIKKTVCEKVAAEQETGSRLGATTKICKTIEVPAPSAKDKEAEHSEHAAPQG